MAINLLNEKDYRECKNCKSKYFYEKEYFTLKLDKNNKETKKSYIKSDIKKEYRCIICDTLQDIS